MDFEKQLIQTNATTPTVQGNPRGEVLIYAKWCKGCHICVEFCPTKVLAFDQRKQIPVVVAPEKCTGCHFCDTHCPDLAIVVRRRRLDQEVNHEHKTNPG